MYDLNDVFDVATRRMWLDSQLFRVEPTVVWHSAWVFTWYLILKQVYFHCKKKKTIKNKPPNLCGELCRKTDERQLSSRDFWHINSYFIGWNVQLPALIRLFATSFDLLNSANSARVTFKTFTSVTHALLVLFWHLIDTEPVQADRITANHWQ